MKPFAIAILGLTLLGCGSDAPTGPPPPPPAVPEIAFARLDAAGGADTDIWISQIDGANARQLTDSGILDRLPHFDPTGTSIYFTRFTSGMTDAEIWQVSPDGTGETQVTSLGDNVFALAEAYHPTAAIVVRPVSSGLSTIDLTNGNEVSISQSPVAGTDRLPSWSRDGTEVAFVRVNTPTDQEVWVVSAAGTNARMVASSNSQISNVDWHPDGTRLISVLFAATTGLDFDLYEIQADGSGTTRLTTSGTAWNGRYSPDGSRIVFREGAQVPSYSLTVVNADGSGQISLDAGGGARWSPDGSRLGYCQVRNGAFVGLAVADANGANAMLVNANGNHCVPGFAWQP